MTISIVTGISTIATAIAINSMKIMITITFLLDWNVFWLIWRPKMALLSDGPLPVRNMIWPEMPAMTEVKKWP